MHPMSRWAIVALLGAVPLPAAEQEHFDQSVAVVLIRSCLDCHSGADPKGGLDLSRQASALRGGESGAAVVPGDPEGSLLWQRIRDGEMPPKESLSEEDRRVLREWIQNGAAWGTDPIDPFRLTTSKRAGYDWWSLQPLTPATPPATDDPWVRNGIDRFILSRLRAQGLAPSPEAPRRVLMRRLCYNLLGLPPAPEELDAFEQDDRPDAYERLVDRLLASPHYGVRWGRHWLDVVRFGESQGFERDKLREDAWHYRDWVIAALNDDLPYDEFARLQIAGDVLPNRGIGGVIAVGCLTCGPWDEVGQQQQSAAMKAVVRQDELEDYLSLIGQTFLGLTVHCARCHDHKFDPIRQEEYYQLAAAVAGVRHGTREVLSESDQRRREELTREIAALQEQLSRLDQLARGRIAAAARSGQRPARAPIPLARWSFDDDLQDSRGELHGRAEGAAQISEGMLQFRGERAYVATVPLAADLRAKTLEAWVRLEHLDQRGGGVVSVQTLDGSQFDAIVFGEQEPRRWMAGSEFFRRSRSFQGPEETEAADRPVHVAIVWQEDGVVAAYRDGRPYGQPYPTEGPVVFPAGKAQVLFGLRHTPPGGNKQLAGSLVAAQLYDRALDASEVAASAAAGPGGLSEEELLQALSDEERKGREQVREELARRQAEQDALRPLKVYTVVPKPPEPTHVLSRGNPATPQEEVLPGGISALRGVAPEFGLGGDADDAARRRKLAEWVTHPDNPLFARVIVNRIWHYHFGAGLVRTTSDFGFNGGRPSHPELLDWLAAEFLHRGQSLKELHRLIVTSAAYRQASWFRPEGAVGDADNRLLWRMSPRRLEAEVLRDAMLAVAGELNSTLGGPGYRDFETFVRNSQFYEVQDKIGPEFQRRTVYRTWVRSGRSPLLDVFDCPDPSTKTPERAVTVTPLQALSLLNNSFVLRMSERLAERVRRDVGDDPSAQATRLLTLAYGRGPTVGEAERLSAFVRAHGLEELCRVVVNSSEFLYVD